MIDYKYFNLFQYEKGNVDKDWKIEYDGGSFTDWDMFSESIELTESLCSEKELRFGCCEAGCLKFKVANIVKPLINEWITVKVNIDHHEDEPFVIGRYKVASEKLTADRQYKDIVAYDAMYDIINADVADWYNTVLPEKTSTVTLAQFRTSFMQYFGISEHVPEGGLVNDDMIVERTIEPEQISGRDVITAICEINGCFGHIGRDGKFHYIYLPQAVEGLYPANDLFPDRAPEYMVQAKTEHLYPQDPQSTRIGAGTYIECNFEDYITKPITKLQIRQEKDDIGSIHGAGDNCYIIQDNFLVYGKSAEQLTVIAQNVFKKITNIVYRPFDADVMGNPCMEVGDPVRFPTKYEVVETYILERTLKGVQALRDNYKANGAEEYSENVNSVAKSIVQLKGKSNVLERTIEKTRLEMTDIEAGLKNEISITAKELSSEITEKTQYTDTSPYTITRNGRGAPSTVYAGEYYLDEDSLKIYLGIAAVPGYWDTEWDDIAVYDFNKHQAETNGVYRYDIEEVYKSAIKEYRVPDKIYESELDGCAWGTSGPDWDNGSPGDVWFEVTERDTLSYWLCVSKYVSAVPAHWEEVGKATIVNLPELSSKVTQTAEGLKSTVKKGDVSSQISQEHDNISITGNRISITSQYFQLSGDGKVNCTGATVSGTIESTGDRGKTRVTNGGFYILNNDNMVAGCFYGSGGNNGGRLDIYTSAGNEGDLAFCASAQRTDVYAGGLRVHKSGVVIEEGGLTIDRGGATITGNLSVSGTKNRVVETKDYGAVLQYCYETTSPMFGDVGTGKIGDDGVCYIYFDPIFAKTVNTAIEYCVFLQKEGEGDAWISKKTTDYFLVCGTPKLAFSWEAKAKQVKYEYDRLENYTIIKDADCMDYESLWNGAQDTDYEKIWEIYLENYKKSIEYSEEETL
ncbi:MAG: hypothetical protein K2H41_05230 [Acetatifactor sp.]|nr:hypothetical protein [Acetatifactor sp.]